MLFFRPEQPVDSIYGLLDIRLCYQTILLGIFLHFTWSYGAMLYRVYSTEVILHNLITDIYAFLNPTV